MNEAPSPTPLGPIEIAIAIVAGLALAVAFGWLGFAWGSGGW